MAHGVRRGWKGTGAFSCCLCCRFHPRRQQDVGRGAQAAFVPSTVVRRGYLGLFFLLTANAQRGCFNALCVATVVNSELNSYFRAVKTVLKAGDSLQRGRSGTVPW